MNEKIRDCHFCEYGCCKDSKDDNIDCYAEDGGYFSHHVENSTEAESCKWFIFNNHFPKF